MQTIMALFPEETVKIDIQDAQESSFGAMEKYGLQKFVASSYSHQRKTETSMFNDISKAKKEKENLQENIPLCLGAEGQASYFEKVDTRIKTLEDEFQEIEMFSNFKNTLISEAISAIKKKKTS